MASPGPSPPCLDRGTVLVDRTTFLPPPPSVRLPSAAFHPPRQRRPSHSPERGGGRRSKLHRFAGDYDTSASLSTLAARLLRWGQRTPGANSARATRTRRLRETRKRRAWTPGLRHPCAPWRKNPC